MKIKIKKNSKTIQNCDEFARERVKQINKYQNKSNLFFQIFTGAIAEFGVARYIQRKLHYGCSNPDLHIYPPNQKTHSADLRSYMVGDIHVKSCLMKSPYEPSWAYNHKCKYKHKDVHAFCKVGMEDDLYVVEIVGLYDAAKFPVELYKEPILKHLASTKSFIYETDLKDEWKWSM